MNWKMKSYIWKSFLLGCVILVHSSCEDLVENMNTNPNDPTDATAAFVFKGAEIAHMAAHEGMTSRLSLVWASYGKGVALQYGTWGVYQITANNFDDEWNLYFTGANKNLLIAIEKANELGNRKMAGVAKILRAHAMASATELWGDIPFSETSDPETYPNPRFEGQDELYPKLQALLDEGIADLATGIGTLSTEDIFLNGDATKWQEVAYTLKARLYTDVKAYAEAYEAAQRGISTYANSLYAPHGSSVNANQNATFTLLTSVRTGSITGEDAYNALILNPQHTAYRGNNKTDETARFRFYYLEDGVNAPGVIEPNTLTTNDKRGFFAEDAPFPLVTYQENSLTLAEMAIRSGKGLEVALAHLNNYRAFLDQGGYLHNTYKENGTYRYLPYDLADFAAGGMENTDGVSQEAALLREILEERYVTFYGQHIGWNDERRNRSEVYGVKLTPTNGSRLPARFIYSQNELNSNSNSPAEAPSLFDPIAIYP